LQHAEHNGEGIFFTSGTMRRVLHFANLINLSRMKNINSFNEKIKKKKEEKKYEPETKSNLNIKQKQSNYIFTKYLKDFSNNLVRLCLKER
jgi:hypothetical protein